MELVLVLVLFVAAKELLQQLQQLQQQQHQQEARDIKGPLLAVTKGVFARDWKQRLFFFFSHAELLECLYTT